MTHITSDHYEPIPECGCWIWMRGATSMGYGEIWRNGKMMTAHRLSWEQHRGPIPPGMHVLHKCDIPACINPNHLFIGTHLDNMRDMDAKGRRVNGQVKGERHGCAKITPQQVLSIRADKRNGLAIAKDYGLCKSTVNKIRSRALWSHIP